VLQQIPVSSLKLYGYVHQIQVYNATIKKNGRDVMDIEKNNGIFICTA
jgi:hypothetical protein